jgi:perosamine synthetase
VTLRTIPPAAAPVSWKDLAHGFLGMMDRSRGERLEREIREYFGAGHVFLVSSGKSALLMILSGLKRLTLKRKVIIPAYTCFSVPSAVRLAGLDVVLCDVKADTLDFDYSSLETLLDDETLCVIPTHLFGVPSDIGKIRALFGEKRIYLVEDAAQAMGAQRHGKKLGTLGDVSFFSLGRGKNITCGSGGIIVTSSPEIAESIRRCHSELDEVPAIEYVREILEILFMVILLHPVLYWLPKSLPFLKLGETPYHRTFPSWRFTGFKAGLLHDWMEKLENFNRNRSLCSDYYLESLGISRGTPVHMEGYPYNRFPLFTGNPEMKRELSLAGDRIGISPMYPSPIHRIRELAGMFDSSHFAGAERISSTLVTLPTHILLKESDREKVRDAVSRVLLAGNKDGQERLQGVGCS